MGGKNDTASIQGDQMRILHVGDTAGVPTALRDIDRKRGFKSDVIRTMPHPFNYNTDFYLQIDGKNIHSITNVIKLFSRCLKYDRIHSHKRPVQCGLDLLVLKYLFNKQIYIHYHGSEIRYKKQPKIHKLVADKTYVSTPDLLRYVPSAEWLPNPVLLDEIPFEIREKYLKNRDKNTFTILHTPTNELLKGTKYVNETIEKLQQDGYNINYELVTGATHAEALKAMAQCDVYIDQLLTGYHGVSSLECACMGVPAICYIDEKLYSEYRPPFIWAEPSSLYETILYLYNLDYQKLLEIGTKEKIYYFEKHKAIINKIYR